MQRQQKEGNTKDQSSNKQNRKQKNNRKAMKPKVGSLKKINKIVKLLARWTKEKIEETQMTKISTVKRLPPILQGERGL